MSGHLCLFFFLHICKTLMIQVIKQMFILHNNMQFVNDFSNLTGLVSSVTSLINTQKQTKKVRSGKILFHSTVDDCTTGTNREEIESEKNPLTRLICSFHRLKPCSVDSYGFRNSKGKWGHTCREKTRKVKER